MYWESVTTHTLGGTRVLSTTLFLALALPCISQASEDFWDSVSSCVDGGTLADSAASDWWYGCSPTSMGMMMAYYDTYGYKGQSFANLVDGTVEGDAVGPWPIGSNLRAIIASEEHQHDFYSADGVTIAYNTGGGLDEYGAGRTGDDVTSGIHAFNCLADFMGTSQDSIVYSGGTFGNVNGGTQNYYDDDGGKIYNADFVAEGLTYGTSSLGLELYIESRGYEVNSVYTQRADVYMAAHSGTGGFSFSDMMAEIDAGRPVWLSVVSEVGGHAMLVVGYQEAGQILEFYNTWDADVHTMAWNGTYSEYEFSVRGVICMELATVPEPASVALLAGFGALFVAIRRRR